MIAGGSGLIGTHFSLALLQQGHRVWILSRDPDRQPLPAGSTGVRWDGKTVEGWGYLVEEMDAIVNLTGENLASGLWTSARKQRFFSSRVEPGRALAEAVRAGARRPKVFVQVSGIGYYGFSGDRFVAEDAPPGSDYMAQLCVQWENATREVEDFGVRRVIMRNSPVFTRENLILKMYLLPFRLFVGGPLGSGKQWTPWIHRADQIGAMIHLIQNEDCRGPFNLVAPDVMRNADFGKTIARVLRRPYWFPVPGFALRLAIGEMSQTVLEGQRAECRKLLDSGYTFKFPTLEEALRDILSAR
jgi:hypothetical protein